MQAPQFSLPDQNGKIHSLSDYKGKWVVLYFYPKDDTPGCTTETCGFRDMAKEFADHHAVILGVSKDNITSHLAFSKKFTLPFPLLSDETKKTIQAYRAWGKKSFMGKIFDGIIRTTVIINPQQEIVKTYTKVNPAGHNQEVLQDLIAFQK